MPMTRSLTRFLPVAVALALLSGCKELEPMLDKVKPLLEQRSSEGSTGITTASVIDAIKQALAQGVGDSVNLLGSNRGFSLSDVYRISIPESLNKPADLLRKLGQGRQVDEFEDRLNLAAEQSVGKAIPVFTSAIKQMSVDDALNIMQGSDNAATVYFKSKTESSLRDQFMPIIRSATDQTGLTSSYKSLASNISKVAPSYGSQMVDIDEYVLGNAMDALFDRIAIEEKMIREQPAKRSTELMKSVYGHFSR